MSIRSGSYVCEVEKVEWSVPEGSSAREHRARMKFSPSFKPSAYVKAVVSLSGIDADAGGEMRLALRADDIESGGFDLVITLDRDTAIRRCHVSWMAHEEEG